MRMLKPEEPADLPESSQIVFVSVVLMEGMFLGYSMLKTGLAASMNGENVVHSENSTHCSFTLNWVTLRTSGMISPAFLRPMDMLRGSATEARYWM